MDPQRGMEDVGDLFPELSDGFILYGSSSAHNSPESCEKD